MVKGELISLFLIVLWVLTQLVVFHLTATRQLFRTLTLLFFVSLPAYVACYLWTSPTLGFLPQALAQSSSLLGLLNGLLFHCLVYVNYVSCFYYIDRPLTLRILIAFLKVPDGKLTLSEIRSIYGLKYMIERRLQAMKDGSLVVERKGRYFLTPKGERLGKLFDFGRKILKIERSKLPSAHPEYPWGLRRR